MGELANSVLNAGGKVIGVEAQMFVDEGVHMDNLTKLYIEKDITNRRTRMIELGDAFIAFPGATGTLEESVKSYQKSHYSSLSAHASFIV